MRGKVARKLRRVATALKPISKPGSFGANAYRTLKRAWRDGKVKK